MITSFVTLPDVVQKYPLPQNLLPQYLARRAGYSDCILRDVAPLTLRMNSLTDSLGGISTNMCTWFDDNTPLITFTPNV